MKVTRKAILDKTHYGLNVYSFILRQHYPGETVLSLSGRDCKPAKNPFNNHKETLVVRIVDGCARHTDSENWEFQGDVFDFAELAFQLSGQELLDKINEVMHLKLDEEKNFYRNKILPQKAVELISKTMDAPLVSYFKNPVQNTIPFQEMSLVQIYRKILENYFRMLSNGYSRDLDQRLFDLIVYFKYYLPKSEYKQFINELKGMLEDLQVKIHPHAFEYIRGQMGIKNLDDLNTLMALPKNDIDYNKFDKQNTSDENNLI